MRAIHQGRGGVYTHVWRLGPQMAHCHAVWRALADCPMRMNGSSAAREMIGEALKALVVLGLVAFMFAPHLPASAANLSGTNIASSSWCGGSGPAGNPRSDHTVCHACRVGIGDLPAPPSVGERCDVALPAARPPVHGVALLALPDEDNRARAPPHFS